jgi:TetR/AcrR family transcriptional regulator, transcriptional repressor for nem operon
MTIAEQRELTPKGRATRERIVEAAADLIYTHGVHETNNELVRKAAGISGSQLSHYFPDKESLVRAVIVWRADSMMGLRDRPPRGPLDSIEAMRKWADSYISRRSTVVQAGCSFGSLVSEVMKADLDVHAEITDGFSRWKEQFLSGLQAMRARGELRDDAYPERLAHILMAAFQGGMFVAQATDDIAPLRDALDGAIELVASHSDLKFKPARDRGTQRRSGRAGRPR